jgi:hypothetical protein
VNEELCLCGCGTPLPLRYKVNNVIRGHGQKNPLLIRSLVRELREDARQKPAQDVKCKCGCGETPPFHEFPRVRGRSVMVRPAFVYGHQWRITKIDIDRQYSRRCALRTAVDRVYGIACLICGWDKDVLDIAHVNPGKNSVRDVVALCPNCHRLFDRGKLSRADVLRRQADALTRPVTYQKAAPKEQAL